MKLLDAIAYICMNYKNDLSKSRLNKILYLADWIGCLNKNNSVTNASWKYNNNGPIAPDIIKLISENSIFQIEKTEDKYGKAKEVIKINEGYPQIISEDWEIETLNRSIKLASDLTFSEFLSVVFSSYPLMSQSKGSDLDLLFLAKKFNELKKNHEKK
jgi:hypothetical protein